MIRSMEFVHPFNRQQVRSYAADFCSHPVQHFTKLLQIRFTSGIINRSHPFGKHGSHHYIGCSGNRGFIEQHISAFQLLCRNLVYPTFFIISKVSSQVLDPHKVRIQSPTTDFISARFGYHCFAKTGNHRSDQHHRSPQAGTFLQEFITLQISEIYIFSFKAI